MISTKTFQINYFVNEINPEEVYYMVCIYLKLQLISDSIIFNFDQFFAILTNFDKNLYSTWNNAQKFASHIPSCGYCAMCNYNVFKVWAYPTSSRTTKWHWQCKKGQITWQSKIFVYSRRVLVPFQWQTSSR